MMMMVLKTINRMSITDFLLKCSQSELIFIRDADEIVYSQFLPKIFNCILSLMLE